jgi:uncharacterized protein (TIGR02594 family)
VGLKVNNLRLSHMTILPYQAAASQMGMTERNAALKDYLYNGGKNLNPATRAWCADFVNASLAKAGIGGTNSGMARSFLNYGSPVDKPQKGDIAVFSRGNPKGPYGHVGFYEGDDPRGIRVLGGNQNDAVSSAVYPRERLLGFRRPPGDIPPTQVAQSPFPDPTQAPPMGDAPTPPMVPTDPPAGMPRIPTPPQVNGPPPLTPAPASPGTQFAGIPAGMPLMPPQPPMQPQLTPAPAGAPIMPPSAAPAPTEMAGLGGMGNVMGMGSPMGGMGGIMGMLGGLFGGGGGGGSQAPAAPPPPSMDPMVLALLAQTGPFKFPEYDNFA